jgi:hypothetical protein
MSHTNIQPYGPASIEAQRFSKGWTAVVYWTETSQSVACVGAKSESLAMAAARTLVDTCVGALAA